MKLSELKPGSDTADKSGEGVLAPTVSSFPAEQPAGDTSSPEPQGVTETTPSGMSIYYSWAPKRLYRINDVEVPSVTTVLGVLDKSGPLTWWGMKVGVEGYRELINTQKLDPRYGTMEEIVELLTEHKLTVNHVKDAAADRGVNIHSALEAWPTQGLPYPEHYPEHEQGYVEGLSAFLVAIQSAAEDPRMEVMVGSLEHLYAGRYDLRLTLTEPVELVTKAYPKRADKVETVPAGSYIIDLKSSKRIYDSHRLQLEAYEAAAVECGYPPTDYRAVLHVTAEGQYEFSVSEGWSIEDFLAVRRCYSVIHEREQIKQERGILEVFAEELGAKDAA